MCEWAQRSIMRSARQEPQDQRIQRPLDTWSLVPDAGGVMMIATSSDGRTIIPLRSIT